MIPTHCRHMTYPKPGGSFPTHCAVGVCFDDVLLPGRNMIDGRPCTKQGRANGATCQHYAAWTEEEIAEHEAEVEALIAALDRGECVTCGHKLTKRNHRFACTNPDCVNPTSGFSCNLSDGGGE